MFSLPHRHSLRFRLLLASLLVEVVLLGVLVANGQRLIEQNLVEQARLRTEELKPLLNAALSAPLAEGDYGTLLDLLSASQRADGLSYLVVTDRYGKILSSTGWSPDEPLPVPDRDLAGSDSGDRYDAVMPITIAGHRYGMLHFGLSTSFLTAAKRTLLQQSLLIAATEILLSVLMLGLVGLWLTRHLERLSVASREVAAGNFDVQLPVHGNDEVADLTRAFNAMSVAVREKLAEIRSTSDRLHAIADYTWGWEIWLAPDGRLLWINPSVERLTGYTPEQCLAMPEFPVPLIATADLDRVRRELHAARHGGTGSNFEFRVRRKDGTQFWAAASWQPIYSPQQAYLGVRASIWDISERKQFELALADKVIALEHSEENQKRLTLAAQEEQARLTHLLSAMNLGILFEDDRHRVLYVNPAFRRIWLIPESLTLTGRETREVIHHSANVLSRPDHFSRHILQVTAAHEVSETYEIALADGRLLTQLSYPVRDNEGRYVGRLWVYEDVTRERQTAEQLIYLAERDSLTGLYNRHRFLSELGRMLAESDRHTVTGALLFFDLDEFKYINDTFGHRVGDAMLIRVAGAVGALVRRNETLARLGGDEFAILLPSATEQEATQLAERVIRAISQIPFRHEQQNLRLTTSLGIALTPQHGTDAEDLIAHADAAMYQAKESGKNAWRIYEPERDTSREKLGQLSWQERIQNAIEKNLLRVHLQGVYRAGDLALTHLEALVRMVDTEDPERLIMPGHFIQYAEKSGRIREIDRWVIGESVRLLAASPTMPPIAVNISGKSFDDPTLPQFIAEQLAQRRVTPERLMVELTETSAVTDLHDAQRFIESLHQNGCRVCLDDFGTGFSSFAYLKHLRADVLKIDGLFIRNLPRDRDNQVFVRAIVDVARGMRKLTIAEFVEDAETLEMLKQFGVDMVQGYHLDKPRADHPALYGR